MELRDLDKYRTAGPFPTNYDANLRRFYTQDDDVHGVLKQVIGSVGKNGARQPSLTIMMFGYDDDELNTTILGYLADPSISVEISLDKSQSGGVHEREILKLDQAYEGNSIAIGTSAYGGQISHEKGVCVDDRFVVGGSTNWSLSGEGSGTKKQNNELTVYDSAVLAAEFKSQAHAAHLYMLSRMTVATASVLAVTPPPTAS
jgi:hypothetical protein